MQVCATLCKSFSQAYCEPEKLLCLYTVGFCNQGVSWSSSCDKLKNFAANIFLKLVCKPRTEIRASIS